VAVLIRMGRSRRKCGEGGGPGISGAGEPDHTNKRFDFDYIRDVAKLLGSTQLRKMNGRRTTGCHGDR
jgi:hypothetical protein